MEKVSPTTTTTATYTYVIIGGGIAGVSCVEQILEFDPTASILLLSSSPVVKEARNVTHLTKTLQDFVLMEKSLKSFKDVHQTVQVVHDVVIGLDVLNHNLSTQSGKEFGFKKLAICSGSRPKVIFPGVPSKFVITIRDTESVQDLATRISSSKRVLLVGNGGIATEFVHEVEGIEIFWAIKDASISAGFVDPGAAEFFIQARLKDNCESDSSSPEKKAKPDDDKPSKIIKRQQYVLSREGDVSKGMSLSTVQPGSALGPDWHHSLHLKGLRDKKNVTILYNTECSGVTVKTRSEKDESFSEEKDNWPIYAELSNGKVVGVDLLICGTGVVPNCDWAIKGKLLEGDEEKGIQVDASMQSSVKDVFAAGDVCFPKWEWAKHWFQMRLWTQARQMGLYTGKCMYTSYLNDLKGAESDCVEENQPDFCFEIFSHVTKFFGFKVVLLGLYNGQGLPPSELELMIRCTKGVEYIKLVLQGGRLQGAILIGDTALEETLENLILNQIDLTPYGEDLLNPDVDIEDYFD